MLEVHDEKIPLRQVDGILYVDETRVTLRCVVEMFDHGASPEEIAEEFSAVSLPDVYAVLTYYLRNRERIRAFLAEGAAESEAAMRSADAAFPNHLREKLLRAKGEFGGRVVAG